MTREEAIEKSTRLVMGAQLDEYAAAENAYACGRIAVEALEPIRHNFRQVLDRRRDQIAATAVELMAPPPPAQACAGGRKDGEKIVRCTRRANTVVGGRHFCGICADLAPRQSWGAV